jgi:hypothetical protein
MFCKKVANASSRKATESSSVRGEDTTGKEHLQEN